MELPLDPSDVYLRRDSYMGNMGVELDDWRIRNEYGVLQRC